MRENQWGQTQLKLKTRHKFLTVQANLHWQGIFHFGFLQLQSRCLSGRRFNQGEAAALHRELWVGGNANNPIVQGVGANNPSAHSSWGDPGGKGPQEGSSPAPCSEQLH